MECYCKDCLLWIESTVTEHRNVKFGKCTQDNKYKNEYYNCDIKEVITMGKCKGKGKGKGK